jgi:hypothetical protein
MDLERRRVGQYTYHTAVCRIDSRKEGVKLRPQATILIAASRPLLRRPGGLYHGRHSVLLQRPDDLYCAVTAVDIWLLRRRGGTSTVVDIWPSLRWPLAVGLGYGHPGLLVSVE